jgi:hypothetical protein
MRRRLSITGTSPRFRRGTLGHLCDVERIFTYRLLRIGRGDATELPGFDEKAYVPAGKFDAVTARALAYIIVGHVAHHLDVLRNRYGLSAMMARTCPS